MSTYKILTITIIVSVLSNFASGQNIKIFSDIEVANEATEIQKYDPEFCIYMKKVIIPLKSWDYDLDIKNIPSPVQNTEINALNQSSNATSQSYMKTITYTNFKLHLFSPPSNGNVFWICSINVFNKGITTYRGIEVGSPLEVLYEAYPEIENYGDGNYWYHSTQDEYSKIQFSVVNGLVESFTLTYEMP